MKPTQKLARKIKNTKNIRFRIIKQKQVTNRTDKVYLLSCQYIRALQKKDILLSLLLLFVQLVVLTPYF